MSDMLRLFEVIRTDETRVETDGETLGWGVQFPSGLCMVDWNLKAYPPDDRLDNPHISQYGSPGDVEQGTGGEIRTLGSRKVDR